MLQLETFDCALSEIPHFFIHHPFKTLSPEKKLQARTLFFSFQIYLENPPLHRFLLFSTRPKVLAFKTERGLISQSPPSGTRHSKGEFLSNQGVDTLPGRTQLSLCVDTSNLGVLPIITSHWTLLELKKILNSRKKMALTFLWRKINKEKTTFSHFWKFYMET